MTATSARVRRVTSAIAVEGLVMFALYGVAVAIPVGQSNAESVDWQAIAQCESGGNWAADTGNGLYGGLQISQAAWDANGGVGSPAAASPQQQIEVADRIMETQGPSAWPKCSSCSRSPSPVGSLKHVLTFLADESGGCHGQDVKG